MKSYEVIDNFLEPNKFKELQNLIIYSNQFTWSIRNTVSHDPSDENFRSEIEDELWSWYGIHMLYRLVPQSQYFDFIYSMFHDKLDVKSLTRVKVNFHPYTHEVKERPQHFDYPHKHKAAVFSLNTCDGFTRMTNGDKIDSVGNRIVLFDASEMHNSSTTSNQKGRYNINFNYF